MNDSNANSPADATSGGLAVFVAAGDVAPLADQFERLRRTPRALQAGGASEAVAWCASHAAPATLIVDISHTPSPLQVLADLMERCGPASQVIAVGERQDVDLYRGLLQNGVFDYLVKPLRFDQLADTLARIDAGTPVGSGTARAGRTVAVVGAGGGVGTSTVVAGLGKLLSGACETPAVLVDFDRRKGDLPLLLGVEADAGLASVLAAPEIDPRLLQRTLLNLGQLQPESSLQRLHLLAQRPGPETPLDPEQVLQLGGALCQLFSLSLWDLPSHRPDGATEVLAHAEVRVVLTELTVQNARSVHRLLAEIGDESNGQRLLLVANAARSAERAAISRAQFEDFVGHRVDVELPYAGAVLGESLLQGALNLAQARAFQSALLGLAQRILGRQPQAEVQPTLPFWLQRVWGNSKAAKPSTATTRAL